VFVVFLSPRYFRDIIPMPLTLYDFCNWNSLIKWQNNLRHSPFITALLVFHLCSERSTVSSEC